MGARLTGAVALLAAFTACGGGTPRRPVVARPPPPSAPAATPPDAPDAPDAHDAEPAPAVSTRQIVMAAGKSGWAIDDSHLVLVTDDGGEHFHPVSTQPPFARPNLDESFEQLSLAAFDGSVAAVVERIHSAEHQGQAGPSVHVHTTADGGAHWQRATLSTKYGSDTYGATGAFGDARNVWVGVWPSHGMTSTRQLVFRSEDGGKSFSRGGAEVPGDTKLVVRSAREAYVMGNSAGFGSILRRTTNGGKSWSTVNLPFRHKSPDDGVSTQDVAFWGDGRRRGVALAVALSMTDGESDLLTYLTVDAGTTWRATKKAFATRGCAIAASASGAIALGGVMGSELSHVFRTEDGATWEDIATLDLDACGGDLAMTSPADVYLSFGVTSAASGTFLASHDGGRKWTRPARIAQPR